MIIRYEFVNYEELSGCNRTNGGNVGKSWIINSWNTKWFQE